MAWDVLLKSDVGLFSLFTIVVATGIVAFIYFFVRGQMRQDRAAHSKRR